MRLRLIVLAAALVAGCSVTERLNPYRIDIRQGNFVSQEQASQLRPGMTRDQVRFLLGTPMLVDPFHGDRWDYVYYFKTRGREPEERKFAVYFQDGKLARVSGDVVAADSAHPAPELPKSRVIDLGEAPASAPPADAPAGAPEAPPAGESKP
ncbi:MAG: outer membrane protein assembly factor BamE [Rhodocyclaceae bacterium]|nr:outer membrane protein assembly factor BamE [Rhodocyclaceae bacterium]MBX3667783.1 outer membrane protein assembly factor BamE [Rhodocyclaceae bacterium]